MSVTAALKEDKIVAKEDFLPAKQAQNSTNKPLIEALKELLSIPRPSGHGQSHSDGVKRANTIIISSKLTTLMSAPQPSYRPSEKDTYLSALLT